MQPFVPEKLPIRSIDWEGLIPQISRANRAISHFDGVLYGVPNPELLLSPLTTQEAVLSSRIEGTQATLDDVLRNDAGTPPEHDARREDVREINNYRQALTLAVEKLEHRPFNLNLLLELHDALLDSVRGRDKGRGNFRRVQNWIGLPGSTIETAQFVPPPPELVMEYMHDWEKYYHAERPDALVQLAIVHAQFEIIHPFLDGNGRLGRILIPLFLYEKKILSRPIFYLSAYLERNRATYVELLRQLALDATAWNRWINFFLTAVAEEAAANASKARAIMALYERLKREVIGLTHSQFAVPMLDIIFRQPIFRATELKKNPAMPSVPMLMSLINRLEQHGIITVLEKGSGRRATLYSFEALIAIIEGR